ncbi:MAG: TetR/AcrR family transcriptional regulator [Acidimicrobiales bacterium]
MTSTPPLRSDAARNRAALVAAAREVMAERGLDVPLDEIARRAGIGNATLYRRFPRRIDLIAAVFADRLVEHDRAVASALAAADPWEGLCRYLETATEMQVNDRGIADLITMDVSAAPEIKAVRDRAFTGLVEVIERAKTTGSLRADATPEDVFVILQANAGLVFRAHRAAAEASRRLVHLLIDGLRAEAATPGARAPAPRRMLAAIRANSRHAGLLEPKLQKPQKPQKAEKPRT